MLDKRLILLRGLTFATFGWSLPIWVPHGHVAKGTSNWINKPMWRSLWFKTHPDNQWHVMKDDDISFQIDNMNGKTAFFLVVWHSAASVVNDSPAVRVTNRRTPGTPRFMLSWNTLIPSPISTLGSEENCDKTVDFLTCWVIEWSMWPLLWTKVDLGKTVKNLSVHHILGEFIED